MKFLQYFNIFFQPHSEMIATYALCGFSNLVALGIMIAAFAAVVPDRKNEVVGVSFRALISGSMACFLTASVAGLLNYYHLTILFKSKQ